MRIKENQNNNTSTDKIKNINNLDNISSAIKYIALILLVLTVNIFILDIVCTPGAGIISIIVASFVFYKLFKIFYKDDVDNEAGEI